MRAGAVGLASLCLSVVFAFLRGVSAVPVFGFFAVFILGVASGIILYKYPEKKKTGILCAAVAGMSFLVLIPGLRIVGSSLFGIGIAGTLGIALWKIGSIIYSVFSRKK